MVKQEYKVCAMEAFGSKTLTEEYVKKEVQGWTKAIMGLAEVALSQPFASYEAFLHGLSS